MRHTFEHTTADKVAENISHMLDNGWEIERVCKYAVTMRSQVGSFHTILVKDT